MNGPRLETRIVGNCGVVQLAATCKLSIKRDINTTDNLPVQGCFISYWNAFDGLAYSHISCRGAGAPD